MYPHHTVHVHGMYCRCQVNDLLPRHDVRRLKQWRCTRWRLGQIISPHRSSKNFAPVDQHMLMLVLARSTAASLHDGGASADLAQLVFLGPTSNSNQPICLDKLGSVALLGTALCHLSHCCPWRSRERRVREPAKVDIAAHSVHHTATLLAASTSASVCHLIHLLMHLIYRWGYHHVMMSMSARAWILVMLAMSTSLTWRRRLWTRR